MWPILVLLSISPVSIHDEGNVIGDGTHGKYPEMNFLI